MNKDLLYLTTWKLIIAFAIGLPLGILTHAMSMVPELSALFFPLLFGGIGPLLIYLNLPVLSPLLYVLYSYVLLSHRRHGAIIIFVFHYFSLIIMLMVASLSQSTPSLSIFISLPWQIKRQILFFSIPAILIFWGYNILLVYDIIKRYMMKKNESDEHANNEFLMQNRYKFLKYGCFEAVVIIMILIAFPVCVILWQTSFIWVGMLKKYFFP